MTELQLPSKEQINKKRGDQFKASISETLEKGNLGFFQNIVSEYLAENGTDPELLAAALAYLAQKDHPIIVKDTPRKERSNERMERSLGERKEGSPIRRQDRSARSERSFDEDKPRKPKRGRSGENDKNQIDMETYRLAVGHNHEVKPGDIVGAIANEADIDSAYIGRIQLFDDYSTVDLPTGMPKELFQHLRKVRVRNQPLNLEKVDDKQVSDRRPGPSGTARKKPRKRSNSD
jgi:ATP-dependent RNA helicase DeaD